MTHNTTNEARTMMHARISMTHKPKEKESNCNIVGLLMASKSDCHADLISRKLCCRSCPSKSPRWSRFKSKSSPGYSLLFRIQSIYQGQQKWDWACSTFSTWHLKHQVEILWPLCKCDLLRFTLRKSKSSTDLSLGYMVSTTCVFGFIFGLVVFNSGVSFSSPSLPIWIQSSSPWITFSNVSFAFVSRTFSILSGEA